MFLNISKIFKEYSIQKLKKKSNLIPKDVVILYIVDICFKNLP
jgi:hypothetical protein